MQYLVGDIVECTCVFAHDEDRPFGGDVKQGKIEKIDAETGGHVSITYLINGEKYFSSQLLEVIKHADDSD